MLSQPSPVHRTIARFVLNPVYSCGSEIQITQFEGCTSRSAVGYVFNFIGEFMRLASCFLPGDFNSNPYIGPAGDSVSWQFFRHWFNNAITNGYSSITNIGLLMIGATSYARLIADGDFSGNFAAPAPVKTQAAKFSTRPNWQVCQIKASPCSPTQKQNMTSQRVGQIHRSRCMRMFQQRRRMDSSHPHQRTILFPPHLKLVWATSPLNQRNH